MYAHALTINGFKLQVREPSTVPLAQGTLLGGVNFVPLVARGIFSETVRHGEWKWGPAWPVRKRAVPIRAEARATYRAASHPASREVWSLASLG